MVSDGYTGSLHNWLIMLDLDDTLMTRGPPHELIENNISGFLEQIANEGALLFISSRNSPHTVQTLLDSVQLSNHFQEILADYRPKEYHVKHTLIKLKELGIVPPAILFIDDYAENCRRVASLRACLEIPIYVVIYSRQPPNNLKNIFACLNRSDLETLRKISL